MIFAMTAGILMSWTLLIVMYRINLRKFLGYPAMLDLGCTSLLGCLLYGTLGGMVTAITGGLFLSLMITVLRRYYGYSRFSVLQRRWVTNYGVLNEFYQRKGGVCTLSYGLYKFWPILLFILVMFACAY